MKTVTENLGLGTMLEEPQEITGGLLHKMYRVSTTQGIYAVKEMNPEIMKRPGVIENIVRSEKIAAMFGRELPVVSALEIQGRQLHFIDGTFYMVFPWIEGTSVFPPAIREKHCEKIGELLGRMHELDLRLPEDTKLQEDVPIYEWELYLKKSEGKAADWVRKYRNYIPELCTWNRKAHNAGRILQQEQVISHRDLDPKNVMWKEFHPYLIDWEAAGWVNPYQEFVEGILYWADDGKDGLSKELFDAFVRAYRKHRDLENIDWETVAAGSCAGILGWLAYNIRRALGIEATDEKEIRLGEQLIPKALKEFYSYQTKVRQIREWMESRFD